jgi:hypothetical protein
VPGGGWQVAASLPSGTHLALPAACWGWNGLARSACGLSNQVGHGLGWDR